MKLLLFLFFLSSVFAFEQVILLFSLEPISLCNIIPFQKAKIAIIGGGVSGGSAAYFLEQKRQELSSSDFQPTIDLFETEFVIYLIK